MNNIILIGRLTKDPESKLLESNKFITTFSLAVDNGKDKNGENITLFINCIAFDKTAEVISKYVGKGHKLGVMGRLNQRTYTNKENNQVTTYEVSVSSVELLEPKQTETPKEEVETHNTLDITDDDLPF